MSRLMLVGAILFTACADTSAPFDVRGAPAGDVNAIASRCLGDDHPGRTMATFEMRLPHCVSL